MGQSPESTSLKNQDVKKQLEGKENAKSIFKVG
jgi:hypothetical protein